MVMCRIIASKVNLCRQSNRAPPPLLPRASSRDKHRAGLQISGQRALRDKCRLIRSLGILFDARF